MTNQVNVTDNVAFEQPVQAVQPVSALGTIASLGGAALQLDSRTRGSTAPSQKAIDDAKEQQRLVGLEDSLRRNEQQRSQIGNARAERRANAILRNYALDGGDLGGKNAQSIISLTTGRDFSTVGFTAEERTMMDFRDSEDYAPQMMYARRVLPEGTPEDEMEMYALNRQGMIVGYEQALLNDKIGWEQGKRESVHGLLNQFTESHLGALEDIAKGGGVITKDAMTAATTEFQILKRKVVQNIPDGIDATSVNNQIAAVEETLGILTNLSGAEGVQAELMADISESTMTAIQKQQINPTTGAAILGALKNQPLDTLMNFGIESPNEIAGLIDDIYYDNLKDPAEIQDGAGRLSVTAPKATDVDGAADQVTSSMNAMKDIADVHSRVSPENVIDQVFNGKVHAKISEIGATDPIRGQELANQAVTALDSQFAVASQTLRQIESTMPFSFDPSTKRVVMDGKGLERLGWNEEAVADAQDAATQFYGGDMGAMFADQGARMQASPEFKGLRSALRTSGTQFMQGIKELHDMGNIVVNIQAKKLRFQDLSASFVEDERTSNGPIANSLGLNFDSKEQEAGLPSGFLERMAMIESSGNPNAQNPNSSAGGLFQFIDSTAAQFGLIDKMDPEASTDAAVAYAVQNAATLEKVLGRKPRAWELYLAHQQGGGGASRLLGAPKGTLAVDVVGEDAVLLNGGHQGMTASEFASIWRAKYNGGSSSAYTGAQPAFSSTRQVDQEAIAPNEPNVPELGATSVTQSTLAPQDATPALSGALSPDMDPEALREAVRESLRNAPRGKRELISNSQLEAAADTVLELLVKFGVAAANHKGKK